MEKCKTLKEKATDAGQVSWESLGHRSELPVMTVMSSSDDRAGGIRQLSSNVEPVLGAAEADPSLLGLCWPEVQHAQPKS